MYDLVVIGCPSFNRITHNSITDPGRTLAGPAITVATTASKLGIENLVMIGSLSSEFRTQIVNDIDALGISEYYMADSPETCGFEVEYNGQGKPVITRALGIPKSLSIRDIPEEFLSSRIIILSPLLQEINSELVEWICNSSDSLIMLDPQVRTVDESRKLVTISELFVTTKTRSYLDYMVLSEHEAFVITGETDPYVAAEILIDSIANHCIITLDSLGSLFFDGKKFRIVPSQTLEMCNPSEVGASYIAGFTFGLLTNQNHDYCTSLGTSVAGFKNLQNDIEFHLDLAQVRRRAEEIVQQIETR